MKTSIYTFAVVLLTFLTACNSEQKSGSESDGNESVNNKNIFKVSKAQYEDSGMQTGPMLMHDFPVTVHTTGMIDVPPQNKAIVSSFEEGFIKNTYLLVGDKVKKGQVLVTLENPDFVMMQQDYAETKERLGYLESEYKRQKTLYEEKIASEKRFLKAKSDYRSALAKYKGLKEKLRLLHIDPVSVENGNYTSSIRIYAPISGSITNINIGIGEHVSPAEKILEIINTDHIHLELNVFEKDILQVKPGQQIDFNIPEASTETYKAEVHLVGTSVDMKNRTVKVHGHLDDDMKMRFSTGMFIEADIFIRDDKRLALPDESVVNLEDGNDYVLLLTKQDENTYTFEKRRVIVGQVHDGMAEIRNHASFYDGSIFLLKQSFNLLKN